MKKKPNILFFLTDDQRFDTIHALGCDEIYTPNLDMFSKESVVFTHAHIIGGTCGARLYAEQGYDSDRTQSL